MSKIVALFLSVYLLIECSSCERADEPITPLPIPPSGISYLVTGEVVDLSFSSATLTGSVNPNGLRTWYYFEYDTTDLYRLKTPETFVSGSSLLGVKATIFDLSPATIYHYRLAANSDNGRSSGAAKTFKTVEAPPPKTFIYPCAIGNTWTYQYDGTYRTSNPVTGVHTWKVIEHEASGGWRLMDIRQDTTTYGEYPPFFTTDTVYFTLLTIHDTIIVKFPEWNGAFAPTIRIPVSFTSYTDTLTFSHSVMHSFLLYETPVYCSRIGLVRYDSEVGSMSDHNKSNLRLLTYNLR